LITKTTTYLINKLLNNLSSRVIFNLNINVWLKIQMISLLLNCCVLNRSSFELCRPLFAWTLYHSLYHRPVISWTTRRERERKREGERKRERERVRSNICARKTELIFLGMQYIINWMHHWLSKPSFVSYVYRLVYRY